MAAAGAVLVKTLNLLAGKVRPGVTTRELDEAAEKFIRSQGAEPAFKGYRGFPGSICASPNSMIVHGIPGPYKLARGDILSVDVGVVLDGWVADAARTFPVGPISAGGAQAADHHRGVAADRRGQVPRGQPPRRRLARHPGARRGGGAVDRPLAGRATGSAAACTRSPRSPTTASPGPGSCSRRGWCSRSSRWSPPAATRSGSADDHWSIYSQDGSLAAHFEFTIAITAAGPRILTPWHEAGNGRAAA